MPPIRVAVWDGSRLWAEALGEFLSRASSVQFVGCWRRLPGPGSQLADVLLLDAETEAFAVCARLRRAGPRPRAILISRGRGGPFALQALESGASGVLGPDAGVNDLLKAIRVVHEGQIWAEGEVVRRGVEELAALCDSDRLTDNALVRLTTRERDVTRLVCSGCSNKNVARRLEISAATVKAHLTRIFQKLGVHSRTELVAGLHRRRPTTKVTGSSQKAN